MLWTTGRLSARMSTLEQNLGKAALGWSTREPSKTPKRFEYMAVQNKLNIEAVRVEAALI